jgi:hypothetical protein
MFLFWFMLGLLGIITTFGVGTALNMLSKRWWAAPLLYLLFSIYLMASAATRLDLSEWILYGIGWLGTLLAVGTVYSLKKRGYPLFS